MTAVLTARDVAAEHRRTLALRNRTWDALAALAEHDLANPVADLLLAAAPSVQKLSLRNQVMLLIQAGEHGFILRDFDTAHGWKRRGREPGLAPGMQIVSPFHPRPGSGASQHASQRGLYRASDRWDFCQTTPSGGRNGQCEPAEPGDPDTFARNLITQLARRDYRVKPALSCDIDHDAQVVAIATSIWNAGPSITARVLITALAQVLVTTRNSSYSPQERRAG